ncbi:hypothetical protein SGRA_1871 [Saprospira grandis str. Lewin]|uniref:Uncharacterized protein n=1 Tax=Saprospira grandis (strain Lewin) TaxID=984262 RepID=H6L0R9_SAPGL|nr:hypothetical protein SGRA_1871 [Saprospira grandis str. Lewin]
MWANLGGAAAWAEGPSAEGWTAVARRARPSRQRRRRAEQTCELRYSPTRLKGGAAPKQNHSRDKNDRI